MYNLRVALMLGIIIVRTEKGRELVREFSLLEVDYTRIWLSCPVFVTVITQ